MGQDKPSQVVGPSVMGQQAVASVNGTGRDKAENGAFRLGPKFAEDLRGKVASEIRELEGGEQTIPITLNDNVRSAVEYLANEKRNFMISALSRSGRYLPLMQKTLKDKGLPPDLAYLVLIESGFRTQAWSPASAVGPWQFISATGKRYGLKINEWVDERMDPVRSTGAAAAYLSDLHEMFGSWYLAAAAYNAGEGKILRGLKKYQATNFWEIAEGNYLRDETKDYVPKFLAAVLIAKEPESYGLTGIVLDPPMEFDDVLVSQATDLDVIAVMAGTDLETLKELNPNLKLWCTPLGERDYLVRVPPGRGQLFYSNYAKLPAKDRLRSSIHTVRHGETVPGLARLYGISPSALKVFNGLSGDRLKKGQKIRLPVGADLYQAKQKEQPAVPAAEAKKTSVPTAEAKKPEKGAKFTYVIRRGDSPSTIAHRFKVDPKDLMKWNGLKSPRNLAVGRSLVIYGEGGGRSDGKNQPASTARKAKEAPVEPAPPVRVASAAAKQTSHKVQDGETLYRISTTYGCSPDEVKAWNGLKDNNIHPGQVILVSAPVKKDSKAVSPKGFPSAGDKAKAEAGKSKQKTVAAAAPKAAKSISHTVQPDDTLWKISTRFKVGPEELRAANGLKDNNIHPGQVLTIPSSTGQVSAAAGGSKKSAGRPAVSYTVQDGDTLWKIAQRFKVAPEKIKDWNSIKNNEIRPGDVLTIKKDQT
ncbi:MAG: LysM peptidoglycan-binding domain-containing protein [Pseudomonadota bacterium]